MSDERRSVKTYVPAEQKDRWQAHADELGMSQSEFVRTMVQAGRRGFSLPNETNTVETASGDETPGSHDLETQVKRALTAGPCSWDELVDALRGDFEDQLEETLDALQDRNRVRYNGRQGGYALVDE
ncbi:DUF5805 domain-containing protein [Halorubrum laminariae]|uniref:DUF5805 domain-containing protein n=1 Tax=Halorubrum laminariae TaxID=1433523 RepID=A0ABD6C0X5_9EURY|nr:DUF5805 domain-containing protein [Halorubrum laminariae]